jgi:murein DD-endopeptidase MepM/ murein hydrolase activator NlpD
MEERSENIGDDRRAEFDLRAERNDFNVGRGAPRDAPVSVHETISRHQAQARKFTEHAAKPGDASGTKVTDADALRQIDDPWFTESPQNAEPPQSTEQPDASELAAYDQPEDTPLSHEHPPRFAPERPGRLHHVGSPTAPKGTPKHKQSASPDAAKYMPSGETQPNAAVPAADKQPAPESQDAPASPADGDTRPAGDSGSKQSGAEKPGKLRFSDDEAAPSADVPDQKLDRAKQKAGHSADRLSAAEKKLPKKRHPKIQRTFDEKSAKAGRKLVFEEEVKSQRAHMKGPLVTRPVKFGANSAIAYGHKKIYQVEHENVGTQAAHKGELLAEGGLRGLYRLHKSAPYRKVEKLGARTAKLNVKAAYQQALHDSPKVKGNIISRMWQKRKIKKQYAKTMREAQKTGTRIRQTADITSRAFGAVGRFAARHPGLILLIGALALMIALIAGLFASCSAMMSGVGTTVVGSSYLAQDADVDNAEVSYTEWETDMQLQIAATESDRPGYDEYRYQVGDISHNPYELMAYLTAAHQEFTYTGVEAVLREIFAEQYQLSFTPTTETRYNDPNDENADGDTEPYDWKVLTVTLTSRSFTEVVFSRLTDEQRQHYTALVQSKGNRQYAGSPVAFNWLPFVSSYYGYRVAPISGGKDRHLGIDIAIPTGTDIIAAHNGVISVGNDPDGYGHYITLTGDEGLVTKYAHLDSVVAADGQTVALGDVIAKSGNTGSSTGPHLHYEVLKDGQYLNPIYFSITNDVPTLPVYGDAGAPMGDGSYETLITEAERYLGYPYVWGGSSPSTSFDCSGYVSWVLTQSGVKNTGRLGANSLYELCCTPVSPSEAQPGDLIFFHSTYSAPKPITHVGIYVGNGRMLHCGSPIQYTSIETSYWQSHFYAFGRITPD